MAGQNVTNAAASGTAERLALEYVAQTDGYMYIYTANETLEDVDVFFDDLTIMHTGINIVQSTDYYPYGLVMRESKDEDYRFGYQGQYAEMDSTTGWNHFELRQYDSKIGRWLVVDPMGQYFSPYLSMGNNPNNRVDPDGGFDDIITVNSLGEVTNIEFTNDNFDIVQDINGNELFRTMDGFKFNFSLYDHFNINKGVSLPSLASIGIGSLGLTLTGLSKMTMLGSNGKFYPSNYKGRGWNFVSKANNLGKAVKVLALGGLIVDGVLITPEVVRAFQSGDPLSAESGNVYKTLGLSALAYKIPLLGISVGFLDFYSTTKEGQQAVHRGLMQRRLNEQIKQDRIQLPSGTIYIGPKY